MARFKRDEGTKPRGRGSSRFGGRNTKRRDFDRPERRDSRDSGRFERRSHSRFGGRSSDRPEMTTVICDSCKQRCEVPFKPTSNKPVYCDECFKKMSSSKSGHGGKDLVEINQKLDKIMKALKIS